MRITARTVAALGISIAVLPLAVSAQRGGFGPPAQQERKVREQFDKNGDNRLDAAERRAAREWLASQPAQGFGRRGGGPFGGGGEEPPAAGKKIVPTDVVTYPGAPVYDPRTLRTLFVHFENADWEKELEAFNNTDVDVPATVTSDGREYKDVGVHFRGMSSYFMVPAGRKRSLNLSFDFADEKQQFGGYKTLNLLNANGDPSFLRPVLYTEIASQYLPTPRMNYMRVVINDENWGIYINAQQFNKDFTRDYFKSTGGARWKVPGSPGGRAGFNYLGDDPASYKDTYRITSKDGPRAWTDLIKVFKVLNETPPDRLEAALSPIFDIDGALRFLAIEIALVNSDGFWARASDYSLYEDDKGVLHILPHDVNEGMGAEEGPPGGRRGGRPGGPPFPFPPPGDMGPGRGFGGRGFGPMAGGPELDPLIGAEDAAKPLRSKLLAVPALRAKYLAYVREVADTWLDWNRIGPIARGYHDLIAGDVRSDTRKLYTNDAFDTGLNNLKKFADERRAYLLQKIPAARPR